MQTSIYSKQTDRAWLGDRHADSYIQQTDRQRLAGRQTYMQTAIFSKQTDRDWQRDRQTRRQTDN